MIILMLITRLVCLYLYQGCSPNAAVMKAEWKKQEDMHTDGVSCICMCVHEIYEFAWKHPQESTELHRREGFIQYCTKRIVECIHSTCGQVLHSSVDAGLKQL